MGRIVFLRSELTGTLSELVGYKAGLALNEEQLAGHVDEHYSDLVVGDADEVITIRSEEAEELVAQLLYSVGHTPIRRRVFFPGIEVFHKFKKRKGARRRTKDSSRYCLRNSRSRGKRRDRLTSPR